MNAVIKTKRLTLAPIQEADRGALIGLLTDEELTRTYMVPDLPTAKEQNAVFGRFLALSQDPKRFIFGVYYREELIGVIHDVGITETDIELGYFISPAKKGRGFATEALSASLRELFSRGFAEVKAAAFEENAASLRVMEKCGFSRTGETETVTYRGRDRVCIICSIKNDSRAYAEERINK